MHDALLISEVLGHILDHLAEDTLWHPLEFSLADDTDRAGRQALAVLARTCRTFSEPALSVLWRRLHSLAPFILCLPTRASYDDWDGVLPPFSEEEWNVVLRYTPRVQELTLEHDDLSTKILQSLWFRTTLLLPNLRKLRWLYGDETAVASIRLLLSPSLVDLHMWLDDGDHTSVLAFLERFHALCPDIKSLYLGHSGSFPHVTDAISRAISRLSDLETLRCNKIDEGALLYIAQSRYLQQFSCTLLNHQPDTLKRIAVRGASDYLPFENLRVLRLHVQDLSTVTPFLRSQHQPFEEVSFEFRIAPTSGTVHEFFIALSSATRRRTLRRIKLSASCVLESEISLEPVGFQVLSPLMSLTLHKLEVNIQHPISLNDDEFVQLIQGWPELETFNCGERSGWGYPPLLRVPTLKGLLHLLARCPKLHDLGLCVDATDIPSLSGDESLICNVAIKRLSVANSPIQEPVARVAQFLLEHLPLLTAVSMSPNTTGRTDYYWMWRRVDKEIRHILGRRSPEWSDSDEM